MGKTMRESTSSPAWDSLDINAYENRKKRAIVLRSKDGCVEDLERIAGEKIKERKENK